MTDEFAAVEAPIPDSNYILPANGWRARDYQQPFWNAIENGVSRACIVWPRRHGKTQCLMHIAAMLSQKRVGTIRHVFPTLKQARAVVWNEVDNDGRPMLSAFPDFDTYGPGRFTVRKREDEMRLEFANGSSYQLSGADEPDTALRGGNAVLWLVDEYPTSPKMRTVYTNVIMPIIRLNGGTVIFAFTPRGKNHGHKLYEMATKHKDWFCQKLTMDDTSWLATFEDLVKLKWPDEEIEKLAWNRKGRVRVPVVPQWMYDAEIAEGMAPALAEQEYKTSFEGADETSIFGDLLKLADTQGRLGDFPYDENYPVETAWDFGVFDHTVVWFIQQIQGKYRFIDYLEGNGQPIEHWIGIVQQKSYHYIRHYAPHDLAHREKWSAKSGLAVTARFGISFDVGPKLLISEGISATRNIIANAYFNTENDDVADGVERVKKYKYQYDEKHDEVMDAPIHNAASHPADAIRTYAVGHRSIRPWAKTGPLHRPLPRR